VERAAMKLQAEVGPPPASSPQPPSGPAGIFGSPLFIILPTLLLMWAFVFRPQQRQQKEMKQMLSQLEKGDTVITSGGIHGRVTGIADDMLTVEIAPNVRVKMNRSAVTGRAAAPKGEGDKS
jgi:preprotein translocase subunit YajC